MENSGNNYFDLLCKLFQVDEIHTRTLHPYGASSKHKSKSHHERNDLIHNESGKSSKGKLKFAWRSKHSGRKWTKEQKFLLTDDDSDDIDANNNRNAPDASHHRQGVSFIENNDSTDSSYKSYNNFNSKTRESNYHDNKSIDMHKKHR